MSELTDEPVTTRVDIHPDDPDDEWSTARVHTGLRLRAPTAILLAVIMVAGGFWGGAVAEKHHGTGKSSATTAAAAIAREFGAARGGTGTGGTGAGADATTGTVIGVVGQTLDISNTAGNIVKIQLGPAGTITRTVKTSLAGLKVGDTVIVTGPTAANGTVTATAIRASAPGATTGLGAGTGGFPGAGGFGAGG